MDKITGLFLLFDDFGFEEVKKMIDVSIFVQVGLEICKERVVSRKVQTGRSKSDAEKHFMRVDRQNWIQITSNGIKNANIIFNN